MYDSKLKFTKLNDIRLRKLGNSEEKYENFDVNEDTVRIRPVLINHCRQKIHEIKYEDVYAVPRYCI